MLVKMDAANASGGSQYEIVINDDRGGTWSSAAATKEYPAATMDGVCRVQLYAWASAYPVLYKNNVAVNQIWQHYSGSSYFRKYEFDINVGDVLKVTLSSSGSYQFSGTAITNIE